MRFRVWIEDSRGRHTPSHAFGERRAAEVFAAHRSRFRHDCFVIVTHAGSDSTQMLTVYRHGRLHATDWKDSFAPEPVIVQVAMRSAVYALAQRIS
jgi:hypothetical protein